MNPKIEVMKGRMITEVDFEKFRYELKQFAEARKVLNVSIAVTATTASGERKQLLPQFYMNEVHPFLFIIYIIITGFINKMIYFPVLLLNPLVY